MDSNMSQELDRLRHGGLAGLRARYQELTGEPTTSRNAAWLIRRIAWLLQARAEGGLSERARQRARDLAAEATLRHLPPRRSRPPEPEPAPWSDPRLPPPGSLLTRTYKGMPIQVLITREGFTYEGQHYPSLSAVAKRITGSHLNGYRFFGLAGGGGS